MQNYVLSKNSNQLELISWQKDSSYDALGSFTLMSYIMTDHLVKY